MHLLNVVNGNLNQICKLIHKYFNLLQNNDLSIKYSIALRTSYPSSVVAEKKISSHFKSAKIFI